MFYLCFLHDIYVCYPSIPLQNNTATMKKASAAFATPFLCGLLLVGIPTVSAQTDTITESFEGVDYFVDRFDGDDQPTFEVAFHNFDFTSTYVFDVNGFVTTIFADSQQYRMSYTNDKLSQIQMVALRRQLEEEQYAADRAAVVETAPASGVRRRLSKCDECHQTWDVVCDNGVDTVCDLKNFDKPFLSTGKVSVGGMCDDFGTLCNERTSADVCEVQCGAVEPQPECQAPLTITLEYEYTGELEIASDASDVPNLELYVLEQGGQSAYWNNPTTVRHSCTALAVENATPGILVWVWMIARVQTYL